MSPRPRLVVALVVGSLLAVFLAYQALFNSGTLLVSVAQLRSDTDGAAQKQVTLTGTVVGADGARVVPGFGSGRLQDVAARARHRTARARGVRGAARLAAHEVPEQV